MSNIVVDVDRWGRNFGDKNYGVAPVVVPTTTRRTTTRRTTPATPRLAAVTPVVAPAAEGMPIDPGTGVTYPSGSGLGPQDEGFIPGPEDTLPVETAPVETAPVETTPTVTSPTAEQQDARNTIKRVLATYGLEGLTDTLYANYTSGTVNIDNPDALLFSIRDNDIYKKRFAANATRLKAGLSELSPGNYIGLENFYRQTMQTNGLPPGFYDNQDDFTNLIANDISAQEFNDRIVDGYRAVADADPEVKRQMTELYGVTESQLAAYFIDPTRTAPILALQAKAAKIGARGKELAGIQVTGSLAEDLARRGITEQQAQAGFTEFAGLGELTADLAGEEATTQSEEIAASFGFDTAAADRLKKKRGRRVGEFQGGGTFTRTRGETSGGTTLAVGTAQ